MKRMLSGMTGGAALLLLLTGCDPELAQIPAGSQEELWYQQLKDNYFSFTPPRTPAPAAYNRPAAPAAVPAVKNPEKPADDPENAVDRAAESENAPVQNAPRAEKSDAKAPEGSPEKKNDAPEAPKEAVADAPAGKPYVVKSGDTLGGIAKQFYGKSSFDDVIFRANTKVIKDRNKLIPGMRLVIPEL